MGNRQSNASRRRLAVMAPGPIVASAPVGCIKIPYATKAEAEIARAQFAQRAVYRCRTCNKWHTTKHTNFKLKTT